MVLEVAVTTVSSSGFQIQRRIYLEHGLLDGVVDSYYLDCHITEPPLGLIVQRFEVPRDLKIVPGFSGAVNAGALAISIAYRKANVAELCNELGRPCSRMRSRIRSERPT